MQNAFLVWLVENWDIIITVLVWGLTGLAAFILIAKVYKIYKINFEMTDTISLVFAAGWLLFIGLYGFNDVLELLQGVLK